MDVSSSCDPMQSKTKKKKRSRPPPLPPRFLKNESIYQPVEKADMNCNVPLLQSPNLSKARYFIIKSHSEMNVYQSMKHNFWCSTSNGNETLYNAYAESLIGHYNIYLFFSVCGTKHFCGISRMCSAQDLTTQLVLWNKPKFEGAFQVEWLMVKDVPNYTLRQVKLVNGKDPTRLRDVEELPYEQAIQFIDIFCNFEATTSLYDDFPYYELMESKNALSRN